MAACACLPPARGKGVGSGGCMELESLNAKTDVYVVDASADQEPGPRRQENSIRTKACR